ncbi:MAG: diacylglycerol kinase family lipid kinase [Candidatus Marinimicrobia bacterium]|nr:diacylglycerol kinase family lipid kinase [Candidatus Neomarinimicrobiota bacterium]
MKNKFCVIINPKAGKGKTARKIPILKEYLGTLNGHQFDLFYSEYSTHAIKLAESHVKEYDAVIAMGGDGTINEVLNGVVGCGRVMGIIPEGRGNDFARVINFHEDIKETIDKIIRFQTETIDVGKIDGRYFMNGVGIGFDGFVNQRNFNRKVIKGPSSYYLSLLECLVLWKPMRMQITVDDREIPADAVFLTAIGNGKYCGGGLNLNPYAEINDGLLDLCVVNNISKTKIVRNLKRLKDGTVDSLDEVQIIKGKKIILTSRGKMPGHYDGELYFPESDQINLEVVEKAIEIIY